MAPDLHLGFGMGMGMIPLDMMTMEAAPPSISGAYMCGLPGGDTMRVDDLLDFGKDDPFDAASAVADGHHNGHLPVHEAAGAAGSSEAPGYILSAFKDDFHIPSEEAAELEWLSRFVDDSFSDDVLPVVDSTSSVKDCAGAGVLERATPSPNYNNALTTDQYSAIPARARSKRSRAPAVALHSNAAVTWSSPTSSSSEAPPLDVGQGTPSKHRPNAGGCCSSRKKETAAAGGGPSGTEGRVRRCAHCASEKTPQWRTGPLGPKTLCNACGVRYKSGRLVPEYRPAASPTFVLTQHSNSHRKVMELRRQKELLFLRHHQVTAAGGGGGDCPAAAGSQFRRAPGVALFCDYEAS